VPERLQPRRALGLRWWRRVFGATVVVGIVVRVLVAGEKGEGCWRTVRLVAKRFDVHEREYHHLKRLEKCTEADINLIRGHVSSLSQ
jgi:hypothetical protein